MTWLAIALGIALTAFGATAGAALITGALFIEIVFSYPGVGSLLRTAIDARDYPLIQGVLLIVTLTVLTVNFLVDLLYIRLDPRVRYAH